MERCGYKFPDTRIDFKDKTGCILEINHPGEHVCIDQHENKIAWEWDYGCTCGCCEDAEHEYDSGCITYNYIKQND